LTKEKMLWLQIMNIFLQRTTVSIREQYVKFGELKMFILKEYYKTKRYLFYYYETILEIN